VSREQLVLRVPAVSLAQLVGREQRVPVVSLEQRVLAECRALPVRLVHVACQEPQVLREPVEFQVRQGPAV
jgi:hypothetical protein